jgi:vacuolar-type H+-ATPase subunit E/Vma4
MTKKELISGIYKRLSKKLGHAATGPDLRAAGISENLIKYHFGNLTNLRTFIGMKVQPPELEAIYEALGVKNGK